MKVESINPRIITWARERSRISIEELAQRMHRSPEEISMWETGADFPSFTCLEDLAYKHLRIPLAVFFFPKPPKIEDPVHKFRRLPESEIRRFSSDTFFMLRLGMNYQASLKKLITDSKPVRLIFREIKVVDYSIKELSNLIRERIGLSISKQFSFHSPEQMFKYCRHMLEESGIFTFKDSFEDRFISGFSLLDEEFPVIMINNSTAFSRQVFTLIHELGHILVGVNGVTDINENYISEMIDSEQRLEIKCNNFAAEVLVPEEQFMKDIKGIETINDDIVAHLAERYSVSREVILRKLLDKKKVSQEIYEKKSKEWNEDYLRARKNVKSSGDYYRTRLAYVGEGFATLAFTNYYSKRINKADLASHLNIKARYINNLESYLGRQ